MKERNFLIGATVIGLLLSSLLAPTLAAKIKTVTDHLAVATDFDEQTILYTDLVADDAVNYSVYDAASDGQYLASLDTYQYHIIYVTAEKDGMVEFNTGQKTLGWVSIYGLKEHKSIILDVPALSQMPLLPSGCEVVAVAMMMSYAGFDVSPETLANEIPFEQTNPDAGYIGNPFLSTGWAYPAAFENVLNKYLQSYNNLTTATYQDIESQIRNSKPVVAWLSPLHGFGNNGTGLHAVTVTGYDEENMYFNDPWTGKKNEKMSKAEFSLLLSNQNGRALTY